MLSFLVWGCLVLAVQSACPQGSTIVSIQLKWLQQTQFAGYFAAQEQGFYDAECLTVNIRPGGPAITVEDEVLEGKAHFGIHWAAQTLMSLNQQKNVTIVAQVFQRVGMVMVSWKSSNINQVADFKGKKVCVWLGGNEGNLRAALVQNNLTWDSDTTKAASPIVNSVDIISQGFSMEALLNYECDVAAATTYNEYAQVLTSAKSPGVLIKPSDLTVMLYQKALLEDSIIASSEWLEDPANQDITVRFLRASFRGWMWARVNPEKTVRLFADKGPLQVWQLNEVNRLVWPAPLGIGVVEPRVLQESADIAYEFNLTSRRWLVGEFYRTDLALAAHQGLDLADLRGVGFVAQNLSFCLDRRADPELCDMSLEASNSFVDPADSTGIIIVILTVVGLVFAVVCVALLVKWQEERVIKSASLPFSLLMCAGAILGLLSNFLLLDRPTDGICHARAWVMGLGFVTFIGNFLVKVWRIHAIFSTKVLSKVNISDSKIYMYFSILLAVQILLLSLYSGLGQPSVQRVPHVNQYSVYDTLCVAQDAAIWNLLIALYAAALLLYGVFLSIQVRNLGSLFNEAKLLGGSIYNMIFVAVVCGPILLFLDMPPTSSALIRALASFAMFTGSLAIVFVPKFCMVMSKSGGLESGVSRNSQNSGSSHHNNSKHSSMASIDTEGLKVQDSSQLMALKEQSLAMIKAIDLELERRSRTSGLNPSANAPSSPKPTKPA
jgi:NitT/TauT family transport system substrate-binding protein